MQWYECTVRFTRGPQFVCDVKCRSAEDARTNARLKAVECGFTKAVKTIAVKPLKG